MLKIIHAMKDLDFLQLLDVYKDSIYENNENVFLSLTSDEQRIYNEQALYAYICDCFFRDPNSFYAVWESDGRYVSALRMEPYNNALLLTALETAPEERNKGYAKLLILAVLDYLRERECCKVVYSHVRKSNQASLAVHKACGFERMLEYAVYLDGSVTQKSCTFCCEAHNKSTR